MIYVPLVDLTQHPNLAPIVARYEGTFTAAGELYFPRLLSGAAAADCDEPPNTLSKALPAGDL